MHVYSNNDKIFFLKKKKKLNTMIYMHSVQNESLCMYIVILLCVFFFKKKMKKKNQQLATWHIDMWRTYDHVSKFHVAIWPRTLEQVAMWPHVQIHVADFGNVDFKHAATWSCPIITRGHVDMCIYYTCPHGHVDLLHVATCFLAASCHVVIKICGYLATWLQ